MDSKRVTNKIRFGIAGVGNQAADNLMPVLQCMNDVEIRAISSHSGEQQAHKLAQRDGAVWSTSTWRDLLNSEEIDAILVAAPPSIHQEIAAACLEAGVHVFVEKPPATDLPYLERLARLAANRSDITTFVDYNFRFGATYKMLLDAIQTEAKVTAARIRFVGSKPITPIWNQDSIERSFLYAFAIHAIEIVVSLFGSARHLDILYKNLDGSRFLLDLTIAFESGATACLALGNYSTRFEYHVELVTSTSIIGILDQHCRVQITGAPGMDSFDQRFDRKQSLEYIWPSLRGGYDLSGYQGALEAFVGSIRDKVPSASPLSASIEVYRIIEETLVRIRNSRGAA